MQRPKPLTIVVAIFGLGAVSVIAALVINSLWFLTQLGSRATSLPATAALPPPLPAEPSLQPAVTASANAGPLVSPLPFQPERYDQAALLPPPVPGTWEATPMVDRARSLGPLGRGLEEALANLQPQIGRCSDEDVQASFATRAIRSSPGAVATGDSGGTVLELHLELQDGMVRIVDAPVESVGQTPEGLVACVQSVLRGRSLPVEEAKAGSRYRLHFPLPQ